jgi:ParB-like chromosome segregation protein Spo0J
MPIVVVTSDARYVVVDGHKRIRCLHRLHRDTVAAVVWEMATGDALIFRHLLQTDAPENIFEQAWLLRALRGAWARARRRRAAL